jgi:hypothetical protein
VKRRRPSPFREHRARYSLARRAASCGRGAAITSTVAAEDAHASGGRSRNNPALLTETLLGERRDHPRPTR